MATRGASPSLMSASCPQTSRSLVSTFSNFTMSICLYIYYCFVSSSITDLSVALLEVYRLDVSRCEVVKYCISECCVISGLLVCWLWVLASA